MADVFDVDACSEIIRRGPGGVRLCNIDDCDRTHAARGMCQSHLRQWRRTGHPTPTRIACTITGCACGGRTHDTTTRVASPARKKRTKRTRPKAPGRLDWVDYDQLTADHDPHWRDQARCAGMPPRLFWPDGNTRADYQPGIAVCERCPVRYPCLLAGLTEEWGNVGGTMPGERRRIVKALTIRRKAAA